MNEEYLGAKLIVTKTHSRHEFVDIFGKLTSGGINIGMKCDLHGLTLEIVNIFVSYNNKNNIVVTVKGCSVDDILPKQLLNFSPNFLNK